MNKKGFTLVELLAVLVIMSLLMVIAIPATTSISNKIKQKMLTTKMNLASQAAVLYGQDNKGKLIVSGTCDNASSTLCCCYYDATLADDYKCTTSSTDKYFCAITLGELASQKYIEYDDKTQNTVLNPVDKTSINNKHVFIIYNPSTRAVTAAGYEK